MTGENWRLRLEITDVAPVQIVDDSLGRNHFGVVAVAITREAHPLEGGEITPQQALEHGRLIAAAGKMLKTLRELKYCASAEDMLSAVNKTLTDVGYPP